MLQQNQRLRRELNSHEAAKPQKASPALMRVRQGPCSRCKVRKLHGVGSVARANERLVKEFDRKKQKTRNRGGTSKRPAAADTLNFNRSFGPPQPALARLPSLTRGGLNMRRARYASAEREARWPATRSNQELRKLGAGRHQAQRCLTLRSKGAPTAGHQARAGGTVYIFTSPGLASRRRCPLSSNVRHPKYTRLAALAC